MRYTPLEKLSRNSVKNFVVNSTYVTHERTDERKGENYIILGINAGAIIIVKFLFSEDGILSFTTLLSNIGDIRTHLT